MSIYQICIAWVLGRKTSYWGDSNVKIEGRAIYSHGSHFLAGFRTDSVIFVSGNWYGSISTGNHLYNIGTAARRYGNRPVVEVHRLHELRHALDYRFDQHMPDKVARQAAREFVRKYWDELNDDNRAVIGQVFGIQRSLPKIARELEAKRATHERNVAKFEETRIRRFISQVVRSRFEDLETWVPDMNAGGLNASRKQALEALRFAKANGYGKRTIDKIGKLRRLILDTLADEKNGVAA